MMAGNHAYQSLSIPRRALPSSAERERFQPDNPLSIKDIEEIHAEAEEFAKLACPGDRDALHRFRRGASITKDPQNWRTILKKSDGTTDISRDEEIALETEKLVHLFDQPKPLRDTCGLLLLSAIVQGFAESTVSSSNLGWSKDLLGEGGTILPNSTNLSAAQNLCYPNAAPNICNNHLLLWRFAGVNSALYLSAAICAIALAEPVQRRWLGRRGVISVCGIVCLVATILAAAAKNWVMLLVARILLGAGIGIKACVTPIYAAELSPSHLRGSILIMWQFGTALGIAIGTSASAIVFAINPTSAETWRWQSALLCLPLLSMITLSFVVVQSPRYLLKHGKTPEAYNAYCAIRRTPLQAARDLFYLNAQIQAEIARLPHPPGDIQAENVDPEDGVLKPQRRRKGIRYWTNLVQLFQYDRTRRAVIASSIVMLGQQACGINVVEFYGGQLFGFKHLPFAYGINAGLGWVNFLGVLPSFFFIDSIGRRGLLLWTYPGMILSMLGACLCFLARGREVVGGLVSFFLFSFVLWYSVGQGPIAFTYAAECFPLVLREMGFSFAVFVNFLGGGILTLFVPIVQLYKPDNSLNDVLSQGYRYTQIGWSAFFVFLNVLWFALIYLFVYETAGTVIDKKHGQMNSMFLEELTKIFEVEVLDHANYQLYGALPYKLKKWRWQWTRKWSDKYKIPQHPGPVWRWKPSRQKESSRLPQTPDTELTPRQIVRRAVRDFDDDEL